MTVVLAANFPSARVLMSDVFVANGDVHDGSSYTTAEKTFAFGQEQDCIAVLGDEAFALVLRDEAKFPGLDLTSATTGARRCF
jgi:hypothetical protein